ncbi:TauD/TfdA family dioxygenase [Aestuariivita sp.]|uniref:TauD/TfdA family dioxygenase n=1 Tax=Aestuariivita sp. TaxID=1872407 RepID=UPI00216DB120|nr:TauD/TfdA family dioxygenase [Aestuariivita sp.]MCE8007533.1 TauD/TfdA family dioxygenase [Aestuariivita sp.]
MTHAEFLTPSPSHSTAPRAEVGGQSDADYIFSDAERATLTDWLDIPLNPYREPGAFLALIRDMVDHETPTFLTELCARLSAAPVEDKVCYYLKNCPVDPEIPMLGFEDQLNEKYRLKKTFVGEAFLAVVTELMGTDIISYRTANNGDLFQDIHPMRELAHTPSQKTVDTIKFHADIPNNRVRPDWVYLLSMRNTPENKVYTVVVSLKEVFSRLSDDDISLLRQPIFYSPHDTIHVHGGQEPGFTPKKPILITEGGREYLAFFEGNTTSDDPRGLAVIDRVSAILHEIGKDFFLYERDLLVMSNNTAVHARRVDEVTNVDAHRNRWLLKTWNVDDITRHTRNLVPGKVQMSDE